MAESLDEWLKSGLDAVPVPAGMRARIGATVGRRGIWRLLAIDAAAVLLAIVAWTGSEPVSPSARTLASAAAPKDSVLSVSLKSPASEPLEISEDVTARLVYVQDDRMILEFERSDR